MRKTEEVPSQLNLFFTFQLFDQRRDAFLDNLILGAENMRWLTYRIKFADLPKRVKNFWEHELEELLDLQASLCQTIASHSSKYLHKTKEDFNKLWKKNLYANMTECPPLDELMNHHKNCNKRLQSAIMSDNSFLSNSGPVIDKIKIMLQYHNNLFNSYYL